MPSYAAYLLRWRSGRWGQSRSCLAGALYSKAWCWASVFQGLPGRAIGIPRCGWPMYAPALANGVN
ncbi:hypothetical protein D3C81_1767040 [compost metagenome]